MAIKTAKKWRQNGDKMADENIAIKWRKKMATKWRKKDEKDDKMV